jgi:NADPH-dependent ferric siderophore reductase
MDAITDPRAPQRIRHETRMRLLEIVGVTNITPTMRRITLKGDMTGFAAPGHADHIKAFFFPQGVEPKLAPIGPQGAEFADGERPQMRDYTPRQYDLDAGTLDLDFVLHGDGPASSWAAQASIGQKLVIGGPRGSLIVPAAFDWYLLVGDETAIPALARRIAELPAAARVLAVIEVDNPAERQSFPGTADVSLTHVYRNGAPAGTTSLILDRIRTMRFPTGTAYAFVAGEASMSKAVRAHLTETRGFDPEYVKAAGYWLLGTADAKEPH